MDAGTPERLRLFVAIQIPEQIKAKMAAAQAELRRAMPEHGVTWTKPEQFHLTLRFLGQVAAERVAALSRQLAGACQGFSPLHLRAERVGAFPDLHCPRVIWVGLHDEAGGLAQMQGAIVAASREFSGESLADKFSGHATLGRAKRLNRRETRVLSDRLGRMVQQTFGAWTVTEVELIRSELSSAGARHTCVERFPLRGLTAKGAHE